MTPACPCCRATVPPTPGNTIGTMEDLLLWNCACGTTRAATLSSVYHNPELERSPADTPLMRPRASGWAGCRP